MGKFRGLQLSFIAGTQASICFVSLFLRYTLCWSLESFCLSLLGLQVCVIHPVLSSINPRECFPNAMIRNKRLNRISSHSDVTNPWCLLRGWWSYDDYTQELENSLSVHCPFLPASLSISHLSSQQLFFILFFSSMYCVSTPCAIIINNQQDRTCGTKPHLGCVVSNLGKWWQPKHLHAPCHNALHIWEFHNK